jgi:hypothetical protein
MKFDLPAFAFTTLIGIAGVGLSFPSPESTGTRPQPVAAGEGDGIFAVAGTGPILEQTITRPMSKEQDEVIIVFPEAVPDGTTSLLLEVSAEAASPFTGAIPPQGVFFATLCRLRYNGSSLPLSVGATTVVSDSFQVAPGGFAEVIVPFNPDASTFTGQFEIDNAIGQFRNGALINGDWVYTLKVTPLFD